ncbi:MAG: hypothetical protein KIT84_06410 [Labilithrix sp.]|nr:hypothetical protein [Labilithrix sp.]MCW5810625.1 hypothetical protein [Labilithrix sp.]
MLRTSRALVIVLAACAITGTAAAQSEPAAEAIEAARADFVEGQAHFKGKRWAEALRSFERSYAAALSPNAQLMIARCLRELGRGPEAAAAFASAEGEAKRRAARGESKYAETAEAAATEGERVRATLGRLEIHVSGDATLMVDKKVVALSKEGDAIVYHEPGPVQVSVKDDAGAEQRQTVNLTGGHTVAMEFRTEGKVAPIAPAPAPPPPSREEPARELPGWMLPAMLVTGGVTLAGTGLFIGFGSSSRATYGELYSRCGAAQECGLEDRAQADAGKLSQTIANVSLGVAIAGVVATAVVLYLGLTNQKGAPSN